MIQATTNVFIATLDFLERHAHRFSARALFAIIAGSLLLDIAAVVAAVLAESRS